MESFQDEYRKKQRAKALANGENFIDIDELNIIIKEATQGPWHWVEHDYSMASLQGPAEDYDHVMSVSPCEACQKRAKDAGNPDWKWGRCTCPTEVNSKLIALAPALAEAYIKVTKYPFEVEPNIYQYDEAVFVWFDETGGVGGASNYIETVRAEMKAYAENM